MEPESTSYVSGQQHYPVERRPLEIPINAKRFQFESNSSSSSVDTIIYQAAKTPASLTKTDSIDSATVIGSASANQYSDTGVDYGYADNGKDDESEPEESILHQRRRKLRLLAIISAPPTENKTQNPNEAELTSQEFVRFCREIVLKVENTDLRKMYDRVLKAVGLSFFSLFLLINFLGMLTTNRTNEVKSPPQSTATFSNSFTLLSQSLH